MKTLAIPLSLALTCACGASDSSAAAGGTQSSYHLVASDSGVTIEEGGVKIVIVDVPYLSASAGVNGRTADTRTVLGHPFGLRDGAFFIGPEQYGPASEGSTIRVAADGVTIDGERRGSPPPAVAEARTDAQEER